MPGHNINATHSTLRALADSGRRRLTTVAAADRERGAGLLEYGLLLVLVLIVAFVSILLFGETIVALFDFAAGSFDPNPGTP